MFFFVAVTLPLLIVIIGLTCLCTVTNCIIMTYNHHCLSFSEILIFIGFLIFFMCSHSHVLSHTFLLSCYTVATVRRFPEILSHIDNGWRCHSDRYFCSTFIRQYWFMPRSSFFQILILFFCYDFDNTLNQTWTKFCISKPTFKNKDCK